MDNYENAKKSIWTEETIYNALFRCSDKFVRSISKPHYQARIDAEKEKLSLNEETAQKLLESSTNIDYIGYVMLKIDFSTDEIDSTSYERDHCTSSGVRSIRSVISELRGISGAITTPSIAGAGFFPTLQAAPEPSTPSSDEAVAEFSSSRAVLLASETIIRSLFNPLCKLWNSTYMGISIDIPNTPMTQVKTYAELLFSIGIEASVQPPFKVSTITYPAKIKIKKESIESLSEKLKKLLPAIGDSIRAEESKHSVE